MRRTYDSVDDARRPHTVGKGRQTIGSLPPDRGVGVGHERREAVAVALGMTGR
jgi:hypothetical protein